MMKTEISSVKYMTRAEYMLVLEYYEYHVTSRHAWLRPSHN